MSDTPRTDAAVVAAPEYATAGYVHAGFVAELERENAALRAERDAAVTAIRGCVDWANGRECEWGDRAENAFSFLYGFLANFDATNKETKP